MALCYDFNRKKVYNLSSKKCIVIGTGGHWGTWVNQYIKDEVILVGVDRGAWHLIDYGYKLHMAIGDFDSVTAEELSLIEKQSQMVHRCDPFDKDLTDTEMAFEWAITQSPDEIILLGALGTRFDHSLANVHLLKRAVQRGIDCKIVDEYNEIILINDNTPLIRNERYSHVSLLPLSQEVHGITLYGFRYPLFNASLCIGQSLGISNVLVDKYGKIEIKEGWLLVIFSRDE